MSAIDDANYFADPRVRAAQQGSPFETINLRDMTALMRLDELTLVHIKYDVCGLCNGHGSVVNPSIDSGGLNQYDMEPEEWEHYWNGGYDIPCPCCHGNRVEPVVDRDKNDPVTNKAIDEYEQGRYECEQERLSEIRMGC
jgi:hypothetical protein